MKKVKKISNKVLILMIVTILMLITLIGLTMAYFTDSKHFNGELNFGEIKLKVTDKDGAEFTSSKMFSLTRSNPNAADTGKVMPGDIVNIQLSVGLESTSEDAYYLVFLTDTNGIFTNATYFSDGTNCYRIDNGSVVKIATDGTETAETTLKVGALKSTDTAHSFTINAKISEDLENQGIETEVTLKIFAIQQANLSIESAQTKLITMGSNIPAGYVKKDYVEAQNNSAQGYLNSFKTDVMWKNVSKIDVSMCFTSTNAGKPMIFSSWTSSTSRQAPWICAKSGGFEANGITISANTNVNLINDGIKNFSLTISGNTNENIITFGSWIDTTWSASWKLESLKMYDTNNNLIRNFIPALRQSDNVVGVLDLVENVFYENMGAGKFTSN